MDPSSILFPVMTPLAILELSSPKQHLEINTDWGECFICYGIDTGPYLSNPKLIKSL